MSVPFTRILQLREFRRHEEAIAMIMEALAQQPENPLLYRELALNRIEIKGEEKQALMDINQGIALAPESAMLYVIKSDILCSLRQGKDAMAAAMKAIELDPDEPQAWCSKSISHCELSEWKNAEEAAKVALALDPDNPTASNLLAHALRLQNRLDESEQESRRRLERD